MKLVFAAVFLLSTSQTFAAECSGNFEAEFIGKVDVVTHYVNATTYTIKDISFYNENILCPLDENLALRAVIKIDSNVALSSDQEVSGVLVFNPSTKEFSIE